MLRAAILAVLLLWAAPSLAQGCGSSPLSCQALAAQDAAAAGIPANVFLAQIQAESAFNPAAQNASGATGIAQILPSTAANPGFGIAPVDPTDPVASLLFAAQYDAALAARDGSLTAALSDYSGLTPANPGPYANAFALAAADANGGGTDFAGGTGGDTLTMTPGPPAAAASASALSFEQVYTQVIDVIYGQVEDSILTVEEIASGPATGILALAIAIMGIMTMSGNMDMAYFLAFALRAAIVITFIQPRNTFYADWVEQLVLALPGYFADQFSTTGLGGTPAQLFDQVFNGWWASCLQVWHAAPSGIFGAPKTALIVFVLAFATILIVIPSLVAMFTVFLISTFLLLVMLTIGPLMILALLFQVTRRFFHGYVNVIVTGLIFALVVDIVLGIFSSVLQQLAGAFTATGSPDTDIPSLMGIAITTLIMAFSMSRLPRLIEAIGGAASVSLDAVGRYMSGGFAAEVAGPATKLAARAI